MEIYYPTITIGDFADRSESSLGANGANWKLTWPTINECGGILDSALTETDSTVYIPNTDKFPASGKLLIGNEVVEYTGKLTDRFTGVTRGISKNLGAWDLSTASYASKSFSFASQDASPVGIVFNNDGTELFLTGAVSDDIFKYTLTTAYDVSTASYSSVSFAPTTVDHMGIQFGDSGKKMYLVSDSTDDIAEYSVAQTSLNDSTAYAMSLKVVQDSGASGYTVTWPTSVDWPSATAPTLTATASAVDQFVFYTYDGGTNWYGFTAGQALG